MVEEKLQERLGIQEAHGLSVRKLRATALVQAIQYGHLKLRTIFGLTNEGMCRCQDLVRLARNLPRVESESNTWQAKSRTRVQRRRCSAPNFHYSPPELGQVLACYFRSA